ncbi:MAG: hypothetical protein WC217_00430 [Candidatus Paceibacterota bacterium]|jgi:hypothetical protein
MSLSTRNALIALGMTVLIIATVTYAVGYLDRLRLTEIETMQNTISTETLSLETQFSLLEAAPCENAASSTTLSSELADLGNRLSYAEDQLGSTNVQVVQLKKQYYLLQIRDYLITKKLAAACRVKPVIVLYFYSNANDCKDCDKAGYALSYLRDTYPSLRVYSFDYDFDLGALKTLIAVSKIERPLPVFVINGKQTSGFTSLLDLEKQFPKGALATTSSER